LFVGHIVDRVGFAMGIVVAGIWLHIIAGIRSGFKLYGTIDDDAFRKVVLILVLLAGVSLIVSASGFVSALQDRT
jgi:uncharacterized membrane protein YfcA